MSEYPHDAFDASDPRYVVDVTAPLPSGRVRFVAAEAAARLHLPVEKLVGLLENRIGPVTKPLAKDSAIRVAEVLDLAGAEVAVREASEEAPVASPPRASSREAAESPANEAPAGASAPPSEEHGPATSERSVAAEPSQEGGDAWGRVRTDLQDDDYDADFDDDFEEDVHDEAMLGRWRPPRRTRRTDAPPARSGAAAVAEDRRAAPPRHDGDDAPRGTGDAASQSGGGAPAAAGSPYGPGAERAVESGLEAADPDEDDDEAYDAAYGWGTRDPFREAERRAKAQRRWILLGVLAVALAVFLGLQWAYSVHDLGATEPPPFTAGLEAYRDGAFVSAARAWRPRAEGGDAHAMYMLGYMAQWGQGRPWSNAEAAGWYREAAERGHPRAQRDLARLYLAGMGVVHDEGTALEWFEAAARGGDAEARFQAGRLRLRRGDHREAARHFRAAGDGHPDAGAWAAFMEARAVLSGPSD